MESSSWRIVRRYDDAVSADWMRCFANALRAFRDASSVGEVARAAAVEARRAFRANHASVTLLDERGWHVAGWDGDAPPALDIAPAGATHGPGYRAGQIIVIPDVPAYAGSDPGLADLATWPLHHLLVAGFGDGSAATGYLVFASPDDPSFSEDELTLISLFAQATGIALDRRGLWPAR